MLSAVTSSTYSYVQTPVAAKVAPVAAAAADPGASPILDEVDISSFSKTDRNTDAGAVKDKKKPFRNIKDYILYMLLMYDKARELKAKPGELHVKMEDQDDLAKVRAAINDAELV